MGSGLERLLLFSSCRSGARSAGAYKSVAVDVLDLQFHLDLVFRRQELQHLA